MSDNMEFKLSRIFAEGWKAANRLSTSADADADPQAAAPNPYDAEPERSRWNEGFTKALGL